MEKKQPLREYEVPRIKEHRLSICQTILAGGSSMSGGSIDISGEDAGSW